MCSCLQRPEEEDQLELELQAVCESPWTWSPPCLQKTSLGSVPFLVLSYTRDEVWSHRAWGAQVPSAEVFQPWRTTLLARQGVPNILSPGTHLSTGQRAWSRPSQGHQDNKNMSL